MPRLTTDYSDYYIEEQVDKNACGEKIHSSFYLRIARYNLFGMKRYIYFTHNNPYGEMPICQVRKEDLLIIYKKYITTTSFIFHNDKICT